MAALIENANHVDKTYTDCRQTLINLLGEKKKKRDRCKFNAGVDDVWVAGGGYRAADGDGDGAPVEAAAESGARRRRKTCGVVPYVDIQQRSGQRRTNFQLVPTKLHPHLYIGIVSFSVSRALFGYFIERSRLHDASTPDATRHYRTPPPRRIIRVLPLPFNVLRFNVT